MLNDVKHVEAVALIRRMRHEGAAGALSDEVLDASHVWLEENHPSPEAYSTAARSLAGSEPEEGPVVCRICGVAKEDPFEPCPGCGKLDHPPAEPEGMGV